MYFLLKKKFFLLKKFNFIIFVILLGSLWSDQELFWGGLWNWDFIETSSLIIAFYFFLNTHFKKNNFEFKKNILISVFLIFINSYILSNLSIHKFSK